MEYQTFNVHVSVDRKKSDGNFGSTGKSFGFSLGGTLDPTTDSPTDVLIGTRNLLMDLCRESAGWNPSEANVQSVLDNKPVHLTTPPVPTETAVLARNRRENTATQVHRRYGGKVIVPHPDDEEDTPSPFGYDDAESGAILAQNCE
jgi:hypothetical protein